MKLIRQAQAQITHVISIVEIEDQQFTINDYYHPSGETIIDSIIHDSDGSIVTVREVGEKFIADIYDLLDQEQEDNEIKEEQIAKEKQLNKQLEQEPIEETKTEE